MPGDEHKERDESQRAAKAHSVRRMTHPWRIVGFLLACVLFVVAICTTYIYAASPKAIRNPVFQHYHFRMQVIVGGKAVNFGDNKFQVPLGQDSCSADLTEQPIHFHDNKDQFVHIHWDGITGGHVLKYYGWDYIGGVNGALGYRFDNLPKPQEVPVKGNLLPAVPADAKLYIYTGSESSRTERRQNDFLKKDLEAFFGRESNIPGGNTSLLDRLFPKAAAHSGPHTNDDAHSQNDLEEINNLLGNVVIFAQKDRPSDKQIDDRFKKLAPLAESTCAG